MADEKKSSQTKSVSKVSKRTEENLQAVFGQVESGHVKLTDKHVSQWLDNQKTLHQHMRNDHKDHMKLIESGRKYTLWYIVAFGAILIIFVGIVAYANKESLDKFIQLFFAFLGGTGVGSAGTYYIRNKDE